MATDITDPNIKTSGTLRLTKYKDNFFLHWQASNSQSKSSSSDSSKDIWEPAQDFFLPFSAVHFIEIQDNPIKIIIHRHAKEEQDIPRVFQIHESEFFSFVYFIQTILTNRIAVPGSQFRYCFEVYEYCHDHIFTFTPPHIQFHVSQYNTIESFWTEVHQFYEKLIIYCDKCDTIPKDTEFPLATAARSSHLRLMDTIDEFISKLPQYEMIKEDEYDSLFESNGLLKDPELFKTRLYHAGLDLKLLPKLLPFIFQMYPLTSTESERMQIDIDNEKESDILLQQVNHIEQEQIQHSKKNFNIHRTIQNDVLRTDRLLPTFKNAKGIGSDILTKFLKMFSLLVPPLGYLQGMNDLFVPIILTYIPHWSDDSTPIDENGNEIDYKPFLPKIFWCFEAMLRNTNHLELLTYMTEYCHKQAENVNKILFQVCPIAAIWMRQREIDALLWCYGDFVLLFKRSFPNIWPIWIQFNTSPNPSRWLCYFMCAIIIAGFDQLTLLPDVRINTLMKAFPQILAEMSIQKIGQIALWLHEKVPLDPVVMKDDETIDTEFEFFKTEWSKRK